MDVLLTCHPTLLGDFGGEYVRVGGFSNYEEILGGISKLSKGDTCYQENLPLINSAFLTAGINMIYN